SHREKLISLTAASLTANTWDYTDYVPTAVGPEVPTRVPLRFTDLTDTAAAGREIQRICLSGAYAGDACRRDTDCPGSICRTPRFCNGGTLHGEWCTTDNQCNGGYCEHWRVCLGGGSAGDACVDNSGCPGGTCMQTPRTCSGGSNNNGQVCDGDQDCGGGVCNNPLLYVYGLERQPFITEVASVDSVAGDGVIDDFAVELFNPYDEPISLYGYYLVPADPADAGSDPSASVNQFALGANVEIDRGEFLVFGDSQWGGPFANQIDHDLVGNFRTRVESGANGWIVYLIHKVQYDGVSVDIVVDQFALDTQSIAKSLPDTGTAGTYSVQRRVVESPVAGVLDEGTRWKAPVPRYAEVNGESLGEAAPYGFDDATVRPVEVNFADRSSFATQRLDHDSDPRTPKIVDPGSFPTTGSMLLLMRHANRSLNDYRPQNLPADPGLTDLAFTSWLGKSTTVNTPTGPQTIDEWEQIDNGRMPVYDTAYVETVECVGGDDDLETCQVADIGTAVGCLNGFCMRVRRYAHHYDPAIDPDATVDDPGVPDGKLRTRKRWVDRPGSLKQLPWGQLVFDYFTTLPLSGYGPYGDPDPSGANPDNPYDVDFLYSVPRVDQSGMRVRGRININAAPWMVLAGVPLVPPEHLPDAFQQTMQAFAGNDPLCAGGQNSGQDCSAHTDCPGSYCVAASLRDELAQGIVAYRDARNEGPLDNRAASGDYALNVCAGGSNAGNTCNLDVDCPNGICGTGRGWNVVLPAFRRGTGFMTVGELANVRHEDAKVIEEFFNPYSEYRMDTGVLGVRERTEPGSGYATQFNENYVEAIALLASLSDWVTVRSDVFTVYGTLRGDFDEDLVEKETTLTKDDKIAAAADVDSRAIRFQETVDRLPTFLGAQAPVRIGQRVIKPYGDVRGD
ncbi:MAG: hypothetical protein PVI86_03835, partial [Phycisphaerae bacterium]